MRDTSLLAYKELAESGKLQQMEKKVIEAMVKLDGTATNFEIAEALSIPINQVTGRTNSLVKKDLIYPNGKVRNKLTGKQNWQYKLHSTLFNFV